MAKKITRINISLIGIICGGVAITGVSSAFGQAFPPDSEWAPLLCKDGIMNDLHRDEAGANGSRDIVGNVGTPGAPAGLRASDNEFFYLRLRLDEDPAPGQNPQSFGWGMEIDLDGDYSTYEILILVDGVGKQVVLFKNTVTTLPNDPNDPADDPPVASYSFSTHGRSVQATDSNYGGTPDYFLDMAVPWEDLIPLGLDPAKPLAVWAASSSNVNSLNGDFACHDGGTGDPKLIDIVSDPTPLDPNVDTDNDGFPDWQEVAAGTDPNDPNSFPRDVSVFEGGGGCSASASSGISLLFGFAVFVMIAGIGRRRFQAARQRNSLRNRQNR